ncbi:NAD(P)-dependent oxidoreductase [Achromobacter xylosoxidans]|uniref:NAD(P)-dependent oxidoreductase n=1 Tax=Alcaligenes xylosoxydans xylosoxydans TaxID=85698 RepID=UPI0006AC9A4E|nr:NAD(P)-binding oxidoreductase [Achromobacter xylosoxidans]KOQ18737.1 NAD-dependent epimerase/dehydratase [Achromobacter xylosoxidans]KOQ27960.1 NAD-dependent epimerase/dehydratase [Achromobacter xylosoxidans]KOQ30032.1 NAD-dependent epimerase/dehydratase [Achromobacter xylosoxidans]KOQ38080.1 NAD-dependent epimerase/dehydratase [Achromobacter xylosoxidans]KOQ38822.1 NAD-dependent epimerase/dehydratase [Achromobacter xylosoxidans]
MTTLVVGASGATGRLLVGQLLERGEPVRALLRSPDALRAWAGDPRLSLVQASVLDLDPATMARHVAGCTAVASCLGHGMSLRGIYGQPRRLVADAVRRLCEAVMANAPGRPVRFVLMNTAGNSNRDLREPLSLAQRAVVALVRALVPPHADNEAAADYLRAVVGQAHPAIEWAVVRPDSLVDRDAVSGYEAHPSPVRSAIFDAGRTSRINVAHFMAELAMGGAAWERWRGRMPVIYDTAAG